MISLVPTPRYYPFRFKLLQLLIELDGAHPNTFLNIGGYIMEVLEGPVVQNTKKFSPHTGPPLDLKKNIHAPEGHLKTSSYKVLTIFIN